MKQKTISIVITCFNEEDNIVDMYRRIVRVFSKLPYRYEILFVDNASIDGSYTLYKKLTRKDSGVSAIIMSRNFGSPQPSFIAGMQKATGDAVVLLHGDIQDPPELIPQFIQRWEKGYDVVYGVRNKRRGYGRLYNFFYRAFYFILSKLAYIDIPLNAGEFSLMDKRVKDELLAIDEYDYNLRCLRAFVGFKQIGVEYIRDARIKGRSTESFVSGLSWAKTIILNFSFKPLTWISRISFIVMGVSFALLVLNVVLLLFYRDAPKGAPTIILSVLFLGGVQLFCLSIIAEYIAKIFLEVKRRPKFIIKEILT